MSNFLIGLTVGIFIGATLGLIITALMVANGNNDEHRD